MIERYDSAVNCFEKAAPEEVGITSASILNMLEKAEKLGLNMHSFMLLRHGKAAVQCWWKPYAPKYAQHIYSFSKSITATAVGFAMAEGLLAPDDRVVSFFPRRTGENADGRIYSLTVRHLLTMTSGAVLANEATMNLHSDWVRSFLNAPLMSFPGEKFVYNSMNTYMLSAILRKVTGKGLVDYLMPRLFEPLEIERPQWAKCPLGVECGGWGLELKTEDMAKFCQLYLDDGIWKGKRVLPEGWCAQVGSVHTDTVTDSKFTNQHNRSGYGFQFWINSDGRSYRADGMLAQYGIIIPEKDVVIVSTGAVPDQMRVLDLIWNDVVEHIDDIPENTVPGEDYSRLCRVCENLELPSAKGINRSRLTELSVNRKVFRFPNNSASMMPIAVRYLYNLPMLGIDEISFSFDDELSAMTWHEDGSEHRVSFSPDGEYRENTITIGGRKTLLIVSAVWTDSYTLEVRLRCINTPHMLCASFHFENDTVTCSFEEEPMLNDSIGTIVGFLKFARPASEKFAKAIGRVIAPVTGRVMDNEEKLNLFSDAAGIQNK